MLKGSLFVHRNLLSQVHGLRAGVGFDHQANLNGRWHARKHRVMRRPDEVGGLEETARCDRAMTARFAAFERELGGPAVVTEFKEALADTAGAGQPGRSTV